MTDDNLSSIALFAKGEASDAQLVDDDFDLDVRLSPARAREQTVAQRDSGGTCEGSNTCPQPTCVRSCEGSCDTCGTNCRPDCR
jgi:hypothetical protein